MQAAARERGRTLGFHPSTVAFDDARREMVVLTWELAAERCPLLDAGPAPDTWVCGAYDARPTVCRAFPVVLRRDGAAYSLKCPVALAPALPGREGFAHAYGESFTAAEAASGVAPLVQRALAFLETAGDVQIARDLTREAVLRRRDASRHVDFVDVLHRSNGMGPDAFLAKIPASLKPVTETP